MTLKVGIIGCGDISDAYLSTGDTFDSYEIIACSNRTRSRAKEKADEYDIEAMDIDELLSNPEIDIVANLTPPLAHAKISIEALEAGKQVYTEKPIATTIADSKRILEVADEKNLFVGSAPDTILGAALQTCRDLIDEGRIGNPIGATVHWTHSGHEGWHPNPDFFYQEGGGPLYDVGPYYLTALILLLGPAAQVTGNSTKGFDKRTIRSEPRHGESLDVHVPTHEAGIVTFESGVIADLVMSFDVVGKSSAPDPLFEIYGTEGTLKVPDPNYFDHSAYICERGEDEFEHVPHSHSYTRGRGVGIDDIVRAIETDWQQRTSGKISHHTLDIMESIRTSAEKGGHIPIESSCERPKPLPKDFE